MHDLCQRLHVVSSAVTEREAWSRGCARSTRPCTTRSNSAPMSLCTGRVGASYRKTAGSDSAGKERSRPACGARPRPTSSGQRHRPPCNVAAPAGLPVERRQLRLRPRSCRQSSRAKTSPRSAPQVAARRRHRHRPQASATGQATTRPSAATSPAPSSSPATGQAGAAPSSAAVVAVANRVARAVGPLRATCCHSAINPEAEPAVGAQVEDKTPGSRPWKKLPSDLGDRRGSVARGGGQFQTRSWSSAARISLRAAG